MAFVADASVAAAWVLADEGAAVADLALDRLGEETATVPKIFWHELRNLLLSAQRRGRIDARHPQRPREGAEILERRRPVGPFQ